MTAAMVTIEVVSLYILHMYDIVMSYIRHGPHTSIIGTPRSQLRDSIHSFSPNISLYLSATLSSLINI